MLWAARFCPGPHPGGHGCGPAGRTIRPADAAATYAGGHPRSLHLRRLHTAWNWSTSGRSGSGLSRWACTRPAALRPVRRPPSAGPCAARHGGQACTAGLPRVAATRPIGARAAVGRHPFKRGGGREGLGGSERGPTGACAPVRTDGTSDIVRYLAPGQRAGSTAIGRLSMPARSRPKGRPLRPRRSGSFAGAFGLVEPRRFEADLQVSPGRNRVTLAEKVTNTFCPHA